MTTARRLSTRLRRYKWVYLIMTPAIAYLIIYRYVPIYGIVLAFKDYKAPLGILGSPWVGLDHFARMFSNPKFAEVLRNTFVISAAKILFAFPAPIIFALLLNEVRILKVKRSLQTLSYLPHFVSWVVVGVLVRRLLSINGPVNFLRMVAGQEAVVYLTDPSFFVPLVVLTAIWHNVGWGSIIYLAAISGIDQQLYEAAQIDGCSRFRKILHITLPSLLPVIVTVFLLRLGYIMNAGFDQIFNLYNSSVYSVADILDTYAYRVGFIRLDFPYSTAINVFKNVLGLVFLIIVNRIIRSGATEERQGIW